MVRIAHYKAYLGHSKSRLMKKLLWVFVFIVSVLSSAEIILRLQHEFNTTAEQRGVDKYFQDLAARIYEVWLNTKMRDPFVPPFLVFANTDIHNPERLKAVFEATRLPTSQTWTSYDFIQAPRPETSYTIHSNSLGFRGHEVTAAKPPDTFRIIVLGSYQAFGHGVNDSETYSAQLEGLLNRRAERKFEVWNGGRHAATAIVGLARMQNEIFSYVPDMLILDYGFVDAEVWGDNVFPRVMRFPDLWWVSGMRDILSPLAPIFGHSLLLDRMARSYLHYNRPARRKNFNETYAAMLALADRHHVPVILVKHFNAYALNAKELSKYVGANVALVDTFDVFVKQPQSDYPPPAVWKQSPWNATWLNDLDGSWASNENFRFYPFRLDYFQLNARGNGLIAQALADVVEAHIKKGVF